jgi:hypothetical protein
MPILGRNCYVFEHTGRSVEVFGYDPVLGSAKLVRRFRTNDRMLRYWRLNTHMESKITSKLQNKYAYPMRRKSEAHEALSLLLHKYGAPIKMIMDDSKEQMFGEFDHKLKDVDVISHPIEPYSPWQDLAELIRQHIE